MSASIARSEPEPVSSLPTFSYAEAAKSKTPAASSASLNGTAVENTESMPKRPVSSDRGASSAAPEKTSVKRTASEGRIPENTDAFTVRIDEKVDDARPSTSEAVKLTAEPNEGKPGSLPSSPEYGTTSTHTLVQEEDISSTGTGNASSESTWDKQSQSSQNGVKPQDKADVDDEQSPPAQPKWDEEAPAAAGLKDAPAPITNVWQQRREAQDAKTKLKQSSTSQGANVKPTVHTEAINGAPKRTEPHPESKKIEPKKKGKGPIEERPITEVKGASKDRKPKASNEDDPGTIALAPPPPPSDAISWPTPETAVNDERKKSQGSQKPEESEREKDMPQPPKQSGKKGWTHVPFVPTAVFNTPLPQARRGGRGPPGGRGDNPPRGRNNASSRIDKPNGPGSVAQGSVDESSKTLTTSSPTLTSNPKTKRASSAGAATSKDSPRAIGVSGIGKPREGGPDESRSGQTRKASLNDSRRPLNVPIPATPQINIPTRRLSQHENGVSSSQTITTGQESDRKPRTSAPDPPLQPKAAAYERKSEGPVRSNDTGKHAPANGSTRERGEERSGRTRGGHRGRGGANYTSHDRHTPNGNSFFGQANSYQPPFAAPSRSFSNHERMPSQSPGGFFGPSPPHRSFRSSSRSQFGPGYASTGGRFSHGPGSGPSHLPNIQTEMANMSYYPQGIMSAVPYDPYQAQVTLYDLVQMQMEYYLSVDNLCKDMYLRKHMDSQGYVFLDVLSQFNRIATLTTDIELIRYVCLNSQRIECKPGQVWQDGKDRLRAREGWANFVLPLEQRDPSAQTDAPTPAQNNVTKEGDHAPHEGHSTSPGTSPILNGTDYQYQSLNAMAPSAAQSPAPTSITNDHNKNSGQTPLSAAVSEFSPSVHYSGRPSASPDPRSQDTKPFTDDEVQHLQILVRQPVHSALPPFQSASSRTFSNGSIDGRGISEELSKVTDRQSRPVNGEVFESDRTARSRSPFVSGSPSKRPEIGRSPPVLWTKNSEVSALDSQPNELALENYVDFRREALKERELCVSGKPSSNMQNLYHFWSHFLIRNFNAPMYEEFRTLAQEDKKTRDSNAGMQSLLQYYGEALLGHRTVFDDRIARHYVEMVQNEDKSQDRPAFKKLRNAWRNGAFSHMNRHKIVKIIDDDLRSELDR